MVIYLAVTISLTEWRAKYRKAMNESENRASSIGVDSLINYETIKHHNAEEMEIDRYRKAFEVYQQAEYATNASLSLLNLCQNFIIGAGLICGSLLAAYMIATKQQGMTSGGLLLLVVAYGNNNNMTSSRLRPIHYLHTPALWASKLFWVSLHSHTR